MRWTLIPALAVALTGCIATDATRQQQRQVRDTATVTGTVAGVPVDVRADHQRIETTAESEHRDTTVPALGALAQAAPAILGPAAGAGLLGPIAGALGLGAAALAWWRSQRATGALGRVVAGIGARQDRAAHRFRRCPARRPVPPPRRRRQGPHPPPQGPGHLTMPPHDPATGLPPIIAAHLGILRRDVDEVKTEQKSHDRKLDLVLDRMAELSGKVSHLSGRLDERRPAPTADAGKRRPSWLTVAIVGTACSAIVGPILTIVARAILAAHP